MAFGLCGVSIGQFNRMTPAEISRMAEAKAKYRDADQQFHDSLNAVHCSLIANINRAKDAKPSKPADFMITRRETEERKIDPKTQVERQGNQLKAWASMTGGAKE